MLAMGHLFSKNKRQELIDLLSIHTYPSTSTR